MPSLNQRRGTRLSRGGFNVARTTATPPAGTATAYFTVNGRCLVTLLVGEVTTVIQNQACNMKVTVNPTTGNSWDVAANLNIQNDAVGTLYLVEGDATALVAQYGGESSGGANFAFAPIPFVVQVGTIDIETSATNTGSIKWDLLYWPLDDDGEIVAA